MKKQMFSAILAIGVLTAPVLAQAQGAYDYELISDPAFPTGNTAFYGVNNRGDVSGGYFVYRLNKGEFTDVTPVSGYDSTSVLGIADDGTLVGSVRVFSPSFTSSGLILDKDGQATVFDHPDGVNDTQAWDANSEGFVVGQFLSGIQSRSFIYDSNTGTFTDIDLGATRVFARGINSRGDVVGNADFFTFLGDVDPCPNTPNTRYGYLRTADGAVTYFDVNGVSTRARGITDSGTIAGFILDIDSLSFKSFVTELDGSQCQSITIADADLLQIPGKSIIAQGIKNSGEVVGVAQSADFSTLQGFIATPQ